MYKSFKKVIFFFFAVALVIPGWQCLKPNRPGIPPGVVRVLNHAGINKSELVKAIGQYEETKDSLQRKALYCLMAQMNKNYTVFYSVQDSLGNHYHFNPENYPDYLALKNAWDSTEQVHGNLIYHADSFQVDAQTLTGNYLINNLNQAFHAYRTFPWSKAYNFQTFCHWILPYRVANEQPEAFRQYFLKEYALPPRFTVHKSNALDVALYLNKKINQKIDYKDTYNKSLNVQTISQLEKSGFGNFYDINIYKVKVLRSFGLAAAMDYSPFLADTNFGYAYTTVILPDSSELILTCKHGVKKLHKPGRLAKLYRRTFFCDSSSLYTIKKMQTSTPPFLGDFYYKDITSRLKSANVWLRLNGNPKYAYLCVFNDGNWHPISWAIPEDSIVLFKRMGRQVVYLPVSYQHHVLMRQGLPFILNEQGIKIPLKADFSIEQPARLLKTSPFSRLLPGHVYTLYIWNGNWVMLTGFTAGKNGFTMTLPAHGLYLITNNNINFNERIFVLNHNGHQKFY